MENVVKYPNMIPTGTCSRFLSLNLRRSSMICMATVSYTHLDVYKRQVHDLRIVPGPTHTNIIFDVVLSPSCQYKESTLRNMANNALKSVDPNYYAVITFDKAYTSLV